MRWILVAALLLANAPPALAQVSVDYCRFYFGEEEYTPPEVLEVLNRGHDSAVRLCPSSTVYDLISRPLQGPFDVCQITQWRLLKDGQSLSFAPSERSNPGDPRLFMMVSEEDCPRQDDRRYIAADDVSAGVFVALVRFWGEMSSSEEGREALLAKFHSIDRSSRDFQEFESAFRSGELELAAVGLDSNAQQITPYYVLELGRPLSSWSLIVDFVGDELVVLGYGTIEY